MTEKNIEIWTRILVVFLVIIVGFSSIGTISAFALGITDQKPLENQGISTSQDTKTSSTIISLGSLRGKLNDNSKSIFAINISFEVEKLDTPFKDELFKKNEFLKELCNKYFSQKSAKDVSVEYEGLLKAELKDILNSSLILGKISNIYFQDLQVIQ